MKRHRERQITDKIRFEFLAWNTRECESWEPMFTGATFDGGPWTPRRGSHQKWYKTYKTCIDAAIKASGWKP